MFRSFFLSCLVLFVLVICPLMAQEGYEDFDEDFVFFEGAGLVVTASRTPEPLAILPGQVTVISAEEIAAATSLTELLERLPGLRFSGSLAGPGSETISMRGFGANSFGRVLILVDGNKINNPDMKAANWNAIPLSNIERIEVLDGSASVQYGNSAVGGVVNIITRRSGERQTLIGFSAGSPFGTSDRRFFSNRQSISHFEPTSRGSFSLAAEFEGSEGFRERQASRTANAAAGAEFFLTSNLGLSLNAFFSDLYFQLPGGLTKEQFETDPRRALRFDGSPNLGDENAERHFGGSAGMQWFIGNSFELNLPLSYRGNFIRMDMESFGSFTDRSLHSLEARPQFNLTFRPANMLLRFLGGVDLYHARLDADSFRQITRTNLSNSFSITQQTAGPFVTARFSPHPMLSFSAGARFDMTMIDAQKPASNISASQNYSAFVYEGGIVFNPFNNFRIYAKYSTLFRYPFVDELAQVSGFSDRFNFDLRPEHGFNAEAGLSWQLGRVFSINANVFFMEIEDEIGVAFLDPDNPFDATNVNLNRTRRLGSNIGLTLTPVDFLSLDGSYSLIEAFFIGGEHTGSYIPLVPAHNIHGSLSVNLPFGLSFGPDFSYTSAMFFGEDYANAGTMLETGFLLGAHSRFVLSGEGGREFSLQISARNLLNRRYASFGIYSWGNYFLYPANGRSVNVSLRYRF